MKKRRSGRKRDSRIASAFRLVFIGMCLFLIWFLFVQFRIELAERREKPVHAEVGIVLGAALRNDAPSPALKERLDYAYKLYKKKRFPKLIVSGGLDHNGSSLTEAQGMKRYLMKLGVPADAIIEENKSVDTFQNLEFSQKLMKAKGWSRAVIITHHYHGARALDMAQYLNYDHPALGTTSSHVLFMPYHRSRETLAYTKWEMDKLLRIAHLK